MGVLGDRLYQQWVFHRLVCRLVPLGSLYESMESKWVCKDKSKDIGIYVLCSLLFFFVILISGLLGIRQTSYLVWKLCSYVSPLTVIGAVFLLLFFSKLEIKYNKFINLCGKSSIAVYLLQGLWGYWFDILHDIDTNYQGTIYILSLFSFLIVVYFGCILVDLLRIKVWRMVEKACFKQ